MTVNKAVTSRQALLAAAQAIAAAEGLERVSIRRVAAACGISVGAVYNYYPAKEDLLLAMIADFWEHATAAVIPTEKPVPFIEYARALYHQLYERLTDFRTAYLQSAALADTALRDRGKAVQERYWTRLKAALHSALEQDAQVRGAVWDAVFTQEALIDWLFDDMLCALRQGREDAPFLWAILSRVLGEAPRQQEMTE